MSEYVTKIRTDKGDKQIDYNALANKPNVSQGFMFSQIDDTTGKTTLDGIDSYPTRPGVFRVTDNYSTVGVPENYGTLVIFNGGSYYMHLYITSEYFWVGRTSSMVKPDWKKIALDNHKHSTADIASGTLPVTRGGTGATTHTSNAVLTGNGTGTVNNVATKSGALYATSANGAATFGTLPVSQGGTGATTASDARSKLGVAAASHNHSASEITSGTLPISRGGTGVTTESDLRTKFGLSLPKKNLLDNWYFVDPVNQRGATSLTSAGYFIDRWQFGVYPSNSTSSKVYINKDNSIVLQSDNESNVGNSTYIRQYIGNPSMLSGKTVTLSARINYTKVNGAPRLMIYAVGDTTVNEYSQVVEDSKEYTLSVTATLPNKITTLWVGVGNFNSHGGKGNFVLSVQFMKLEIGSVSTLKDDEAPKKSEQLLECQRYYVKFPGNNVYPGYRGSSGSPCASIQLPVPLRTNDSEMIDVQFGQKVKINGTIYNSIASGCTVGYDKSNIAVKEYGGGNSLMVEFTNTYTTSQCPYDTALNFVCKDLEISADLK